MLDALLVALTALIVGLAITTAGKLLRGDPAHHRCLSPIGLNQPPWPTVLASVLLISAAAVLIGWWIHPVGIAGIVALKLSYLAFMIAYRRGGVEAPRGLGSRAMSLHSLAALALIVDF